jgi:hypothetical protein
MTNTQHTPLPAAWHMDWEQIERDTRIRAAAPELLEVLENVLPWLQKAEAEGVFANCAAPQGGLRAINRARAAIAKATGAQS